MLDYEDIQRVSQTIGIYSRKVASKEITAFNLMFQATENLLKTTNISKKNIDCLVCITQTPDYLIPGNSFLLSQKKVISVFLIESDTLDSRKVKQRKKL
ncbi:MAG: hypothetical protein ACKPE1_03315, partial [Dolichospermum sp.]